MVVDSGDQLGHGVDGSDRLVMTEAIGAHGQADDTGPVGAGSSVQPWLTTSGRVDGLACQPWEPFFGRLSRRLRPATPSARRARRRPAPSWLPTAIHPGRGSRPGRRAPAPGPARQPALSTSSSSPPGSRTTEQAGQVGHDGERRGAGRARVRARSPAVGQSPWSTLPRRSSVFPLPALSRARFALRPLDRTARLEGMATIGEWPRSGNALQAVPHRLRARGHPARPLTRRRRWRVPYFPRRDVTSGPVRGRGRLNPTQRSYTHGPCDRTRLTRRASLPASVPSQP